MATSSANVRVAVTGELLIGSVGATAPTTTASATTTFTGLGYISDDGITESRSRDTNDITAFQNGDTVRTVVTSASLTYALTLIETKKETLELYYGVTATTGASEGSFVVVPAATGGRKAFILDVIDGSELRRTYIPQGEVTEIGDLVYQNGEPIGYEVTISAYPDSVINGSAKVFTTSLKTSA